mmetsp:Transcript_127971/g.221134  ORF Transcript_127971/g.221134 Transcript_127971/m.221134 type:complete len:80 (-) Transcript_127971:795-1034(-)
MLLWMLFHPLWQHVVPAPSEVWKQMWCIVHWHGRLVLVVIRGVNNITHQVKSNLALRATVLRMGSCCGTWTTDDHSIVF